MSAQGKLEEWEINKYWDIFSGLNPVNNVLTGDQVSPVLKNSNLSEDKLAKIWDLADVDSDGCLDFEEFCITMRLIFDLLNNNINDVPSTLPQWLVPQSKAHLIEANNAISQPHSKMEDSDDEDLENLGLSTDFDWYISPADRDSYSAIFTANCDRHGRVSYDALTELYQTLTRVPEGDIAMAWNLVNPKSDERIEKEQCLVFLHMLNYREKGVRIPRGVPASLRATFEKATPEFSINSSQAELKPQKSNAPPSKKESFANGYLQKLGIGGGSYSTSGTDFSATKDTDWEEVRLKRELTDLENLVEKAERAAADSKQHGNSYSTSHTALIKRELEQLLDYKEDQLRKAKSGAPASVGETNLKESEEEVNLLEMQVNELEVHQQRKQQELDQLEAELAAVRK